MYGGVRGRKVSLPYGNSLFSYSICMVTIKSLQFKHSHLGILTLWHGHSNRCPNIGWVADYIFLAVNNQIITIYILGKMNCCGKMTRKVEQHNVQSNKVFLQHTQAYHFMDRVKKTYTHCKDILHIPLSKVLLHD